MYLEINTAIFDRCLVNELETHFREDLDVSRQIDLESWRERPLHKRLGELATELIRQSL